MADYPIMYGIWKPKQGWIRGENNQALMFTVKDIAIQTADRLKGCKVYFIDQSLVDIEQLLLEAESKSIPLFERIHSALKA